MPTNRELSIIMRLRDHASAAFKKASTVWGRSLIRLKKIAVVAMKALAALAAIGIAAVTFAFVKGMRAAGKYMLELDKLNKVTDVSVERLGRLIYAMEQEHGSREALEKGLISLTFALGEAGRGQQVHIDHLNTLNIAYRDNEGRIIRADELMMKLSDRFSEGSLTTKELAAAMTLLGRRTFKDMVPFLKLGREHIEALGDEAERLGLVIGGDVVRQAKRFDDEMTIVKAGLRGVWLGIKTGLLPHLEDLAKWFADEMPRIVERAKEFGDAIGEWIDNIGKAEGAWQRFGAILTIPMGELTKIVSDIDRVSSALKVWEERMEKAGKPRWGEPGIAFEIARKRVAEYTKDLEILRKQQAAFFERQLGVPPEAPPRQMDAHIRAHKEYIEKRNALEFEALAVIVAKREKMGLVITEEAEKLQEALAMIDMDSLEKEIFRIEKQAAAWREYFGDRYEAGVLIAAADKERLAEIAEWEEGMLALARANYKEHGDIMKHIAKETAEAMRQSMSTFFFDAITGELKTTEDYMRAFGTSMARMLSELLAQQAMLRMFGAGGGLFPAIGRLIGLSKGGRIGGQGQVQPLPYAAQEGAMVARGRAVPIIAHEGEWIGTPARLAAAGIGGGKAAGDIVINYSPVVNTIDRQGVKEFFEEHRNDLVDTLGAAMDDNHPARRMG